MSLKLFSLARLKLLAVWEDAFLEDQLVAIFSIVSLSIAQLVHFRTELTPNRQAHQLIQYDSLHFNSLKRVILTTASIRTPHTVIRQMRSAQHVIAGLVSATDRIL